MLRCNSAVLLSNVVNMYDYESVFYVTAEADGRALLQMLTWPTESCCTMVDAIALYLAVLPLSGRRAITIYCESNSYIL